MATSFGVFAALAMPLAVGLVAVGLFIVLAVRYMSRDVADNGAARRACACSSWRVVPGAMYYTWTR